jgi:hypothetical protein
LPRIQIQQLPGTSTFLNTQLAVGNYIKIGTARFKVVTLTSNVSIVVTPAAGSSASGLTGYKIANQTVNTYISFNEPVRSKSVLKITIANTASGNSMVSRTVVASKAIFANNTLVFSWRPITPGTYKIQAQTMANGSATAANVYSLNSGSEPASRVISGVVSNTASTVTVV